MYGRLKWKKKVNVITTIIIEYDWICLNKQSLNFWIWQGSQYASVTIVIRNGKIVWKHGPCCWYLGWPCRVSIKTAKNGEFCEELRSENDFEAVLATFCCYDYGAKASEAVQKIAHRCVTRDFLGQGSFLRIRAIQWTFTYNTRKKIPSGKNLRFFRLETLKNFILNEKFYP